MQPPLLVASDVDGTLLDPHERVPARAFAAIERLVAAGVGFVLVTGRPPRWIPIVVEQLPVAPLAVCANGGVLYDSAADRVLWAHTFDAATLAGLAEAVAGVLPSSGLAVERVGATADDEAARFVAEPAYRHVWPDDGQQLCERSELVGRPGVKMLVRCPELSSDAMVAALAPVVGAVADLTFSYSGGLVELSPPGVTKATGLADVAQRLGVARADVVAFGDMPNDLEMLRWAGHGVAMGNAHHVLREVADEVAAHHGEDGLALVLERWF